MCRFGLLILSLLLGGFLPFRVHGSFSEATLVLAFCCFKEPDSIKKKKKKKDLVSRFNVLLECCQARWKNHAFALFTLSTTFCSLLILLAGSLYKTITPWNLKGSFLICVLNCRWTIIPFGQLTVHPNWLWVYWVDRPSTIISFGQLTVLVPPRTYLFQVFLWNCNWTLPSSLTKYRGWKCLYIFCVSSCVVLFNLTLLLLPT